MCGPEGRGFAHVQGCLLLLPHLSVSRQVDVWVAEQVAEGQEGEREEGKETGTGQHERWRRVQDRSRNETGREKEGMCGMKQTKKGN